MHHVYYQIDLAFMYDNYIIPVINLKTMFTFVIFIGQIVLTSFLTIRGKMLYAYLGMTKLWISTGHIKAPICLFHGAILKPYMFIL